MDDIPLSPKYFELQDKLHHAIEEYCKKMSKDEKMQFNKLCDLMSEEQAEICLCHYIEGFKFGLLMGIEVAGERYLH